MTEDVLLRLTLRREQDIFAVRQHGREAAAALGLEHQDQIRIATALSDVGRQMLQAGPVEVDFTITGQPQQLRILMRTNGQLDGRTIAPVGRLVDVLELTAEGKRTTVMLSRRIPHGQVSEQRIDEVQRMLAASTVAGPLDELTTQNEHLLSALDEARRQRDRLEVLNNELEETNRGVMALYLQLNNELEETNRGVVALYAELDEKSGQLRAASEAKTRFLANVSHELRAPVASVIGLLRLISDPESDPLTPAQAEQIELIRSSATDLLSLVNDLLDLAKAESGRLDPVWTLVDLGQLFKQLRGTIRAVLTTPEVQLVVDVPDDGSWIESDEAMLSQVLRNLLHNAVKFTDAGEVSLRARCQDGAWIITVADTGIGIAPAHHERIFEEFYQLPSRARVRGTGLGLPYARKLVTVLGGSLGMESEPGRGSVFTVTLPVSRTLPVAEQP